MLKTVPLILLLLSAAITTIPVSTIFSKKIASYGKNQCRKKVDMFIDSCMR